ncbi:MAG: CPBP family intramembrane glutamic endopeptidase [Candidatus Acidiferrales bacterium]|jgi:membrane protease YdiL (CAAX protease family)
MTNRTKRVLAFVDAAGLPIFILAFIWRLQFTARWTWVFFVLWLVLSFLFHRDTPKTIGARADNLWPATKQAAIAFAIMAAALIVIGLARGAPSRLPAHLISPRRLWTYFAFCVLQQVALNSLLANRLEFLTGKRWLAALLAGVIFAACHWPNPVLVPITFVGGSAMAWLFLRERNIIPLAIMQALLGTLAWWSFPVAWHHHLRVGPGYYLGAIWPSTSRRAAVRGFVSVRRGMRGT